MNIEEIPVEEIFGYAGNPRRNDAGVNYVANSIREFGFKQPIVIDANNEIVCGHTRYKAALKLHMKTVPCVRADDLTEAQIRAYRIADNRTAEFATWDTEKLAIEKQELEEMNFDLSGFGFGIPFKAANVQPISQSMANEIYTNEKAQTAEEHQAALAEEYYNNEGKPEPVEQINSQHQPIFSKCPRCGRIHIAG